MTDIVQRLRTGSHRMCVSARLDPLRVDRPCDPCTERLDAADEIERRTLPPGTWRVTVAADGTFDVVPLVGLGHLWVSVPDALRGCPIWADVPKQRNDR